MRERESKREKERETDRDRDRERQRERENFFKSGRVWAPESSEVVNFRTFLGVRIF